MISSFNISSSLSSCGEADLDDGDFDADFDADLGDGDFDAVLGASESCNGGLSPNSLPNSIETSEPLESDDSIDTSTTPDGEVSDGSVSTCSVSTCSDSTSSVLCYLRRFSFSLFINIFRSGFTNLRWRFFIS